MKTKVAAALGFLLCEVAFGQYSEQEAKQKIAEATSVYFEDDTGLQTPMFKKPIVDAAEKDLKKSKRFSVVSDPKEASLFIVWGTVPSAKAISYRNSYGVVTTEALYSVCMYVLDENAANDVAQAAKHTLYHDCEMPSDISVAIGTQYTSAGLADAYHDLATAEFKAFLRLPYVAQQPARSH
jgi:hypothetical protein